ncbi:hypothetical protein BC332_15099 [Capsicum chinense]|nr:hypothetical protein BC332_15099 [Capsicum chinense]
MLRKCIGDPVVVVPLESVDIQNTLSFEEVTVEIGHQVHRLRNKMFHWSKFFGGIVAHHVHVSLAFMSQFSNVFHISDMHVQWVLKLSFRLAIRIIRSLAIAVKSFLEGEIAPELGDLRDMIFLDLQRNQLTGSIPPSIFNITSMKVIALSYTNLNGKLPTTIWKNEFVGTLPSELANLTALTTSSTQILHLEGEIPVELGNLQKLQLMGLSLNEFTGSPCKHFQHVIAADPRSFTNQAFRNLKVLGLRDNLLDGVFQAYVGTFSDSLQIFEAAAHNRLEGPIPESFGRMLSLEFLDLCYNNLTGEIPKSLEGLLYLKYLKFSFNKLSGEVPTDGPSTNLTSQSFLSNVALCGDSRYNMKPSITKSTKKSRRKRVLIGLYLLLGVGSLFVLAVG